MVLFPIAITPVEFAPGDLVQIETNPAWGWWSGRTVEVIETTRSRFPAVVVVTQGQQATFDPGILTLVQPYQFMQEVA